MCVSDDSGENERYFEAYASDEDGTDYSERYDSDDGLNDYVAETFVKKFVVKQVSKLAAIHSCDDVAHQRRRRHAKKDRAVSMEG